MAAYILVNIGSVNGLLPDRTEPLPEPMLSYYQRYSVPLTWEQFDELMNLIHNMCLEI